MTDDNIAFRARFIGSRSGLTTLLIDFPFDGFGPQAVMVNSAVNFWHRAFGAMPRFSDGVSRRAAQ
jgi:hypothetical protein